MQDYRFPLITENGFRFKYFKPKTYINGVKIENIDFHSDGEIIETTARKEKIAGVVVINDFLTVEEKIKIYYKLELSWPDGLTGKATDSYSVDLGFDSLSGYQHRRNIDDRYIR